jgi:hypothetical protein
VTAQELDYNTRSAFDSGELEMTSFGYYGTYRENEPEGSRTWEYALITLNREWYDQIFPVQAKMLGYRTIERIAFTS